MSNSVSERVIAYVDGFNLYFGMKEARMKRYYWLDIATLAQNLLRNHQRLERVRYCTARVSGARPTDSPERRARREASRRRQCLYLDALATRPKLDIVEGHYLAKPIRCFACGASWETHEEKMTDVNIATYLLGDAFEDRFDTALIVSGDSDLVPPVRAIRERFPSKRIVIATPPRRSSADLNRAAHAFFPIGRRKLAQSQLPDEIHVASNVVIRRPTEWR